LIEQNSIFPLFDIYHIKEKCPAYWFLFVNILGGYMLLFHQWTMRIIYCVW